MISATSNMKTVRDSKTVIPANKYTDESINNFIGDQFCGSVSSFDSQQFMF